MDVRVANGPVSGRLRAPPSKSYTHRAILAAGYADGTPVEIERPLVSADTRATMRAVTAFGGTVSAATDGDGSGEGAISDPDAVPETAQQISVTGFDGRPSVPADVIDCANSGTTTRLVTAAGALGDGLTVLTGDDSLRSRPHGPLLTAIDALGGRAESTRHNGQAPLVVGGHLDGGAVEIPGDVSSQFVTALLMAGAVIPEGIDIALETPLKSAPYVEITRDVCAAFGVNTLRTDAGFRVPGDQRYVADTYAVPGDFSSASYFLAAGAVAGGPSVEVAGLVPGPQGDSALVDVLAEMGADVAWDHEAGVVTVERTRLSGVEVSVADTPDLLPTLAVLGAVADGTTRIVDAEHVRYKETDRVSAMATELDRLGAVVEEAHDALTIRGGESDLVGTRVAGHADHRIVMALSVAGLAAAGETVIEGADHVGVSFPGFFDALADVGATIRLDDA